MVGIFEIIIIIKSYAKLEDALSITRQDRQEGNEILARLLNETNLCYIHRCVIRGPCPFC